MTTREHVAAMMLQGIVSSTSRDTRFRDRYVMVREAVDTADALLAEIVRTTPVPLPPVKKAAPQLPKPEVKA